MELLQKQGRTETELVGRKGYAEDERKTYLISEIASYKREVVDFVNKSKKIPWI